VQLEGRTPCTHQHTLKAAWLESIFREQDLGVLVDNKLNIAKEVDCQKTKGVGSSPLVGIGEVMSVVLHTDLDSAAQERHRHTGESTGG